MINIKKIGATALVGSLAAVSAYAGELAVTGNATVSYSYGGTAQDATADTGVSDQGSFGHNTALNFVGTGELENGYTFVMAVSGKDKMAAGQTSSYTSLTMGSLGTLTTGTHTGGAASKYDEEVPQAYEQASDALSGGSSSSNKIGDQLDSAAILYNSPEFDFGGTTASFDVDYSPQANDSQASDGGQQAADHGIGAGMGLGVTLKAEGVTFGIYGAQIENTATDSTGVAEQDSFEGVTYVKYSTGPVSVGFSRSHLDSGKKAAGQDKNIKKAIRTSGGIFDNEQVSIAYNVNENFSVSLTQSKDTYTGAPAATLGSAQVKTSIDTTTKALQAAYSMGAMSIKAYRMEVENPQYDDDAAQLNVTEIALGLAF